MRQKAIKERRYQKEQGKRKVKAEARKGKAPSKAELAQHHYVLQQLDPTLRASHLGLSASIAGQTCGRGTGRQMTEALC